MSKQIALVTGANKGIGQAVADQLTRLGMTVYLGSRDETRGRAAAVAILAIQCPMPIAHRKQD